jgi:hypothetical protein
VLGIDIGVERGNLLAVKPNTEFTGPVDEVRSRIEALPGVTAVAVATGASLPLIGRAFGGAWGTIPLRPVGTTTGGAGDATAEAMDYYVSANYFDVAGVNFVRGGTWSEDGTSETPPAVLDVEAARRLFGDTNPIGRLVVNTERDITARVVGIVSPVYARGPEEEHPPTIYYPLRPDPARMFAGLFVKTSRPPSEMVSVVTEALRPVAPNSSRPYVFAAAEALNRITATRRFNAWLMVAYGLVGLVLAAAGVYAVMASVVAQQTREIGVRLALGATPAHIRHNVMALASRHVLAGLAIGLPLAWWLSRGLTALLFQVTPADPSVYVGVAILVGTIGLIAAWAPARRAARIDPIISLKG